MTLADLAALGNFIGGIAVVVSFIFLAFQLRQSTHNQRVSIAMQRTALTQEVLLTAAGNEMSRLIQRGNSADPTLTSIEAHRYLGFAVMTFWLHEEHFYQRRDGMLDEARWATNTRRVRSMIASPGFRAAWRASATFFEPDFASYIEDIIRETPLSADSEVFIRGWLSLAAEERAKVTPPVQSQPTPA